MSAGRSAHMQWEDGRKRRGGSLLSRKSVRHLLSQALTYALLAVGGFLMLIPFVWMLSSSLKEPAQIFIFPPRWIPDPVAISNYREALLDPQRPFYLFYRNTIAITAAAMVGQILTGSLVAFSFARLRWPGRDPLFLIVLSTMMLPSQVTLIPTFVIFKTLNWLNTFYPLIVPAWFGGGAFSIFLMRQFFMTVPLELDDAAKIDGCGILGTYWRIILPLSRPVLGTVAIFSFMGHWNEFMGPLIYINDKNLYTVQLGLTLFRATYTIDWHLMMAGSVIALLPVLAVFFVAQRYFIQGIVFTGVKG